MLNGKNTNILATIGPGTSNKEVLGKLIDAGANGFRLNFSHGSHEDHQRNYNIIRELEKEKGKYISILADMQGPKLRVGKFAEPVMLEEGQSFRLELGQVDGCQTKAQLPHPEIFEALKAGDELLVNDGNIVLKVEKCDAKSADTKVIVGGMISSNKGVNVPDTQLNISAVTPKDEKDLEFALSLGVDYIGLSFVQAAEDVRRVKKHVAGRAWIISKIEKPSAIRDIDEIVEASDAIMIARGDLGVECPIQKVPSMQKMIVATCRDYGRPVIVATQMLESMIGNPMPTRAEASDVANAVYEGADCVMLSAETAVGKYPVEAVSMMRKIINEVEADPMYHTYVDNAAQYAHCGCIGEAIPFAATAVTDVLDDVATIVTYTMSGKTTLAAAKERPQFPITAITTDIRVARRMGLVWGTQAFVVDAEDRKFENMQKTAAAVVSKAGLGQSGDNVVITAGIPFNAKESEVNNTNLLQVITLP